MKWIAWRQDGIGPNGRPAIELRWHEIAPDTVPWSTICSALPTIDIQLYRFEGDRCPGTLCGQCQRIQKKRIAKVGPDVVNLR